MEENIKEVENALKLEICQKQGGQCMQFGQATRL